jgi:PPOX class probable F420-dependent enzyme
LATLDAENRPHVVPVCFLYDGSVFYTAVDKKPKRLAPEKLARVRHIRATPQVALLIDEYYEEWTRLWFVLVRGLCQADSEIGNQGACPVNSPAQKKVSAICSGDLATT